MRAIDGLKCCSKCGEIKSVEAFNRNKSVVADGLSNWCKACVSAGKIAYYKQCPDEIRERKIAKTKAWRESHKEHIAEYGLAFRAAHPDIVKAREKAHKMAHRAETSTYRGQYNLSHWEQAKEKGRAWKVANPDKMQAYRRNRRAHRVFVGGSITSAEWQALLTAYGRRCLCCGSTENLAFDHVIPISKGGPNIIYNAQPLCRSCNGKKGIQHIDYRPPDNYADWL